MRRLFIAVDLDERCRLAVAKLIEQLDRRLESSAGERPLSTGPFELRFDRVGTLPEHGAFRVVWLRIAAGAAETTLVFEELEQRLRATGFAPDPRPFSPHLTLGRFRDRTRRSDANILREFKVERLDPVRVEHVTVYESHLTPHGPRYESLLRVGLGAADGGTTVPSLAR